MKITYCDRCKRKLSDVSEELRNEPIHKDINPGSIYSEYMFPHYEITEKYARYIMPSSIDLCGKCCMELHEWIHEFEGGD